MEAVVSLIAVQAQLLVSGQADPVAAGDFSAAAAHVRIKEPGLFRQGEGGFLHREHLLRVAALVVGKGLLPGHFPGTGVQHQADRSAGFPVVKGESLLSPQVKQQIPLSNGAAQHHLDAIHAAGIVFADAHHLLVIRKLQVQKLCRIQGGLVADG